MPGYAILASPWWLPLVYVVILGHLTNICVTLYLHRSATHEGVIFHPVVAHAMRLWLWLTTGMNTKEWVAVHRKHHAFSDREGDPHSPHVEGLAEIVFAGVFFYRAATKDREMIEKYGRGCPDDWVERNVYSRVTAGGLGLMLLLDLFLFGPLLGFVVWAAMAMWIPVFGNVINGIGHALGYRNFDTKDKSRNIIPLGIWIVGEELHNNHHADPKSAKFRARWYEFDIGWVYIKALSWVKLANVIYARSASVKEFTERHYQKALLSARHAADEMSEAWDDASRRASEAVEGASRRASEAVEGASRKASEAVEGASRRASEASRRAHEAMDRAAGNVRDSMTPPVRERPTTG
jgi:stearoyl-CoA desaturase (Delta-9 desaturase)